MVGDWRSSSGSATLEQSLAEQTAPQPQHASTPLNGRPTIFLVGRSWFTDPDRPRGTSLQLLNKLPYVAQYLSTAPAVSFSVVMPAYELDVLRSFEVLADKEQFQPRQSSDRRRTALKTFRASEQLNFIASGYTQDSLAAPLALRDQYRFGDRAMRDAGIARATAAMMPRSAFDFASESLLRTFDAMAYDVLVGQRSKAPYELAPKMTADEPVITIQNGSKQVPALIGDRVLASTFDKYLSGHIAAHNAMSMFEQRLASLQLATGEHFGVLLFDLESIASQEAADRFVSLLTVANTWTERGGLALHKFDPVVLKYTQALAERARVYDVRSNAVARAFDEKAFDGEERRFGDSGPYYRPLALIARDRGYCKARDRLDDIAANRMVSARETDCRMLVREHAIITQCLAEGKSVLDYPSRSGPLRNRLTVIDRVCRLYGEPSSP